MKTTLIRTLMALSAVVAMASHAPNANASEPQAARIKNLNLRLTVGEQVVTAELEDNATSQEFVSLLPLTLTLKDYSSTEKISDLPKRLSTQGAPAGILPRVGDIAYYAPWGNLAFFYKVFDYSRGLIKIARISSGMTAFAASG